MLSKISTITLIISAFSLFCATAHAAPMAKIQDYQFGSPSSSLSLMDDGVVNLEENGKVTQLMVLNADLLQGTASAVDGITVPLQLIDLTPGAWGCPRHGSSDYQVFKQGSPVVIHQDASNCHLFGPEFPAGGQAGTQLTQYQNVERVTKTLDAIRSLYYRLKYGQ